MGKVTTHTLQKMKDNGERIAMLTAYDYPIARLLDEAGIDVILVGDSLGPVVLGYEDTTRVTMDDMVHHTKAVARAAERAMVVADLPFLSVHTGAADAVRNAGRLIQEGGATAVKLEGGERVCETVRTLVNADIPVMGHLGLTPQAIHVLGGHFIQGKTDAAVDALIRDVRLLEQAGAFAVVLECVPAEAAAAISAAVTIPTIGIGAGAECGGQVLVTYDMLGLYQRRVPSFAKAYRNLSPVIVEGVQEYIKEVKTGAFPSAEYSFPMKKEEKEKK